ncbi:unnamed protein product [Ectocarpus sp. 13 AM-2016]
MSESEADLTTLSLGAGGVSLGDDEVRVCARGWIPLPCVLRLPYPGRR